MVILCKLCLYHISPNLNLLYVLFCFQQIVVWPSAREQLNDYGRTFDSDKQ